MAIEITSDGEAFVYEGKLDAVTQWLINRPKAVAVFEKKVDWRISKTIEILNIDEYCLDLPKHIFPLTNKLDEEQLSNIRKNVSLKTRLNEMDVLELIGYTYRLKCISNNILRIEDTGPMEVEIQAGDYASGSIIRFKKIKNKWLIKDYYEYIR